MAINARWGVVLSLCRMVVHVTSFFARVGNGADQFVNAARAAAPLPSKQQYQRVLPPQDQPPPIAESVVAVSTLRSVQRSDRVATSVSCPVQ